MVRSFLQQSARRRARAATVVAMSVAALATAGCSQPPSVGAGYAVPTTAPSPSVVIDPYSGVFGVLDGKPTTDAVARRQVVVVPFARGVQTRGLDQADVVVVEAPAGRARSIGLYQSQSPAGVGPVGPLRPLDGKLAATVGALIASDGSSDKFTPVLAPLGVVDASAAVAEDAYRRTTAGPVVDVARLQADLGRPDRASSLLTFARGEDAFAAAGSSAVTQLSVTTGERTWVWNYDASRGAWSPAAAAPCPPSTSLVVQEVPFKSLRVDKAGTTEPAAQVLGRGRATVVSGALGVTGTWSRPGNAALTNYADASGTPVRLQPGRTCVVLVPVGSEARLVQ
jgi:hypothetical protein